MTDGPTVVEFANLNSPNYFGVPLRLNQLPVSVTLPNI